ncbi:hypothetical protein HMPREF9069_01530 [Atopobium sp. oral taxon 810 str. F0209]|nr:hypothetical protein HMPREF9069_01530 [Atopobium sp. oral taxon 810 str. F0209]
MPFLRAPLWRYKRCAFRAIPCRADVLRDTRVIVPQNKYFYANNPLTAHIDC